MGPDFDHRTAVELSFTKLQLTELHEEIFRCQVLSVLDLSDNFLSDIEKLRDLKRLKNLNVSHNRLKELPEVFASSGTLEQLDLSNNQLKELPEWMAELPRLKRVDLSWNQLRELSQTKCLWPNVRECVLRVVGLFRLPLFLSSCKALKLLDLSNREHSTGAALLRRNSIWSLSDGLPRALTVLRINNVNLSSLPNDIDELICLEELSASENALTTLPESFSKLRRLRRCDLSRNQIMMLPEPFCDSSVLEYLDLYGNVFDSFELSPAQFSNLKQLDLWQNYCDPLLISSYEELCANLRAELGDDSRLSQKLEDHDGEINPYDSGPESFDENEDLRTSPCFKATCDEEECWDDEPLSKSNDYQPDERDEESEEDCMPTVQNKEVDEHYFLPACFHPATFTISGPNSVQISSLVGQFDDADD